MEQKFLSMILQKISTCLSCIQHSGECNIIEVVVLIMGGTLAEMKDACSITDFRFQDILPYFIDSSHEGGTVDSEAGRVGRVLPTHDGLSVADTAISRLPATHCSR